MSLEDYNSTKVDGKAIAGCEFPPLESLAFCASAQIVTWSEVEQAVRAIKVAYGWHMQSGEILIDNALPTQQNVIEGEWSDGQQTLKVKLLHGDDYLLTRMSSVRDDGLDKVCREQKIVLRHDLWDEGESRRNVAIYRYWWAQSDDENPGLWLPYAQQFIRYDWCEQVAKDKERLIEDAV